MSRKLIATLVAVLFFSTCLLAQQQEQKQKSQKKQKLPPAAQWDGVRDLPKKVEPVTGGQGPRLTDFNASTTNSAGVATPGEQTTNGIVQQWGVHTSVREKPYNPKPGPGAPPNWEQVGQQPGLADTNAAAAYRAEVGGPEGTLGVNGAQPSYAGKATNGAGKNSLVENGKQPATSQTRTQRKPEKATGSEQSPPKQ